MLNLSKDFYLLKKIFIYLKENRASEKLVGKRITIAKK